MRRIPDAVSQRIKSQLIKHQIYPWYQDLRVCEHLISTPDNTTYHTRHSNPARPANFNFPSKTLKNDRNSNMWHVYIIYCPRSNWHRGKQMSLPSGARAGPFFELDFWVTVLDSCCRHVNELHWSFVSWILKGLRARSIAICGVISCFTNNRILGSKGQK